MQADVHGPGAAVAARARLRAPVRCAACRYVLMNAPTHWRCTMRQCSGPDAALYAESVLIRCRSGRCGIWNEVIVIITAVG